MRDARPEPPAGTEPVLERFDFNRIGSSWAVVRLVARLREEVEIAVKSLTSILEPTRSASSA